MRIKRKRLIWQIYPSYLLLLLITLFSAGWYASVTMRDFYMGQIRQNLTYQANLLVPQILPLVATLDARALRERLMRIARDVPTRVTVILPDGTVLADSESDPARMENHGNRPEVRQALQGQVGTAIRFSHTLGLDMMYLTLPLNNNAEIKGVLRVAIALTAIEERLFGWRLRLALSGITIALLASLACLIISRRISRPIESMRQGAERFAQGDLSHRLLAPDTQELAGLAQAMNQMAQELEQRMQAIVRQRGESQAVLSSMVEGVLALDADERVLHLNAAAAKLLNANPDFLQNRSIQEVVRNRVLHDMIQNTLTHGTLNEKDLTLYHKGEQILHMHCSPLIDARGARLGVLLVMNDVTRLRRLESMRSDFAANVSHEMKTPLTAIRGFVETLRHASVEDPKEVERFLEIIHKHVLRLTAVIDDLMKLARLEQGNENLRVQMEETLIQPIWSPLCSHAAPGRMKKRFESRWSATRN